LLNYLHAVLFAEAQKLEVKRPISRMLAEAPSFHSYCLPESSDQFSTKHFQEAAFAWNVPWKPVLQTNYLAIRKLAALIDIPT